MHSVTNSHQSINCQVTLPLSKSIINRLLVINHFSGSSALRGFLSDSSDTVVMQNLVQEISNRPGNPDTITEINVGNAGTVMRFLTAILAVTPGRWIITGTERMQQRPLKPLTDALQHLGTELTFGNTFGYPPVTITGNSQLKGGSVKLNSGISSQFISAMMMLGPVLDGGLEIELQGDIISESYIRMTQSLMQKGGIEVSFNRNTIKVKEGKYQAIDFHALVEPDWSAAAFWYEVAAFAPEARILLKDLKEESVQGDSVLPAIYVDLGVKSVFTNEGLQLSKSGMQAVREFNYDFTDCPDLAQAVIVTCAALGIKGRFSGLKTLRVKETDRIAALQNELNKLGFQVNVIEDQIILDGANPIFRQQNSQMAIYCHDDHRMAMSFAPLAILHEGICLDEPEVVKKSYPGFWKDMAEAGILVI
jgi:3-phosphoshikimate 1-carboxyvinyltransferase